MERLTGGRGFFAFRESRQSVGPTEKGKKMVRKAKPDFRDLHAWIDLFQDDPKSFEGVLQEYRRLIEGVSSGDLPPDGLSRIAALGVLLVAWCDFCPTANVDPTAILELGDDLPINLLIRAQRSDLKSAVDSRIESLVRDVKLLIRRISIAESVRCKHKLPMAVSQALTSSAYDSDSPEFIRILERGGYRFLKNSCRLEYLKRHYPKVHRQHRNTVTGLVKSWAWVRVKNPPGWMLPPHFPAP